MVLSDDATWPLSDIYNVIVCLHMPIVNIIMLIFSKGCCHFNSKAGFSVGINQGNRCQSLCLPPRG